MENLKIFYLFCLTLVFANGFPKFGDKTQKSDQNSTLIEVTINSSEPNLTQESTHNQKEKSIDNNNNNKGYSGGQEFHYEYSSAYNDNSGHNLSSNGPKLEPRNHFQTDNQQKHESSQQILHFPRFSSLDFGFPEASASSHYDRPLFDSPPIPPLPPLPPQQSEASESEQFQYQKPNYGNRAEGLHFHESQPQQNFYKNEEKISPEFSFNIPQGFPDPKNDPRANFKKELMGSENSSGKPWGTKMSYTYRDPKNPNNYMEMSEVRMSVNRLMDPKEAETQIQKFLTTAQNGNYGPFRQQTQAFDRNHDNDNHESSVSHYEPPEPSEPKFPNF